MGGCYGLSVISVTVTKGGHLRGSGLYGTSKTIRREVSRVTWLSLVRKNVETWECNILTYRRTNILSYSYREELCI